MHSSNSYNLAANRKGRLANRAFVLFAFLSTLLFFTTVANAQCVPNCLFYGGDFELSNQNANALPNENDTIVGGTPYGAATFQNFVIPAGHTWNIQSLFTNNLSSITDVQSAYFEIRTGVSEGNGGTPIISGYGTTGAGTFAWTPTTRNGFGLDEYMAHVTGLNVNLGAGTYWESVVPQAPNGLGRIYNTNTFSRPSGVGQQISDQQYWDSPFFGNTFTNADNLGNFPTFSSGIDGVETPEPSSLIMLGSGLASAAGLLRKKLCNRAS